MKNLFFIIILSAFLATSCKTDFEINDEWSDITIVYSLLNVNETTHYIRVGKGFLGNASAYDMLTHSDSIQYTQDLTIILQEWKNGTLRKTFPAFEREYIIKEDGLFATDNHYVYKTTGQLDPTAEYKFIIDRPGKSTVSSTTKLINGLTVTDPQANPNISFPIHNSTPKEIKWKSTKNGRVYDITITFHYWEITANDTVEKTIIYNGLPATISQNLVGEEPLKVSFSGSSFLSFLGNTIEDNPNVIARVVKRKTFDFNFTVGDDNIYTYMQISSPSSGIVQERPSYTNIENGIGIFASRFNKTISGVYMVSPSSSNYESIDVLSIGESTKHLKFKNATETGDYWSITGE